MKRKIIKNNYEAACNAYLKLFCEKHDFDYEDAMRSWVVGDVGTIALCGDYYVAMETIRADIDMDAPEEEFIKWYDYCQEVTEFHFESMNFQSWLRGAPRVSKKVIDRLRALKDEISYCIHEEKERINGSK